ncbi:MAG: putative bicarbonate transporter, IctB family [Synechococcaceae cyanobacterium SM2_3_1]|nr:putative bicarbonate transporter, IctB family [Synechococcaceae cyanobacterium SM2_3_1]
MSELSPPESRVSFLHQLQDLGDTLALVHLDLQSWWQASVLSRIFGWLHPWEQESWLLRLLEPLLALTTGGYFLLSSQASTTPLGLLLLLTAGLVILLGMKQPPALTPVHLILGGFWLLATLATLASPVRAEATEGWIKLTLYLIGFLGLHHLLRDPRYRTLLVWVLLFTSLFLNIYGVRQHLYGVVQTATWVDPNSRLADITRIYSYLGNPNLYAGFLVPLIPLSLGAALYYRRWGVRLLAAWIGGLNLLCLLLTYSRAAWLGGMTATAVMGVLSVFWFTVDRPPVWRRNILISLAAAAALMLTAVITQVDSLRVRLLSIFAGRQDSSNNFRLNVWLSSLDMIRDFPWLGIGPGNDAFNRVYPLYQRADYSALSTYSLPLELAVEVGIPGLLMFGWMLFVLGWQGWKQWQVLLLQDRYQALWIAVGLAAMAGMLVNALLDPVWYRPQIQMLWWFAVALVTSLLPTSSGGDDVQTST